MKEDRKWRLICYDISDPKRYRRVHKILRGVGRPVQYSIFRCKLDERETERLRWQLAHIMEPLDRLLIVDLCPGCARRVVSHNHVDGWVEHDPTFSIVSSANHGSANVSAVLVRRRSEVQDGAGEKEDDRDEAIHERVQAAEDTAKS
jgi:CRISPR-associated protein Cas2